MSKSPPRVPFSIPYDAETEFTVSPSPSSSRVTPIRGFPSLYSHSKDPVSDRDIVEDVDREQQPLLGGQSKQRKPFHRPRPLWIVPFAVLSAVARGMTLAPRVQVYTQLSCNALHQNYNHTNSFDLSQSPHSLFFPASPPLSHGPLPIMFPDISQPRQESPSHGSDDDRICASDPAVQVGAARLQTALITIMGFLSVLTTGWWGRFSERHGRLKVLAGSSVGLLATDFAFVLVSLPVSRSFHISHYISPHVFLLLAAAFEGIMGGYTTLQASVTLYVSDCTSDGSRALIFSRLMGVFYTGFAIGPMLGAAILRHAIAHTMTRQGVAGPTNGVPYVSAVFYASLVCTVSNFLLTVLVIPESVHKARQRNAAKIAAAEASQPTEELALKEGGFVRRLVGPLSVFAPTRALAATNGTTGKDWSLTLLALGVFGYLLGNGIFQIKYLFAQHVYGWGAEELSYYISFVGGARAVNLLLVMPFFISRFKPKPTASSDVSSTPAPASQATINFDLRVAKVALFIDLVSHTLVSLPLTASAPAFAIFSSLSSFSSGAVPAIQSLALILFQRSPNRSSNGIGALFGGFSALQATGQLIFGPLLFGMVYSSTVATYPKAIFVLASGLITAALAMFSLVRTRERSPTPSSPRSNKIKSKGKGKAKGSQARTVPGNARGRSPTVKHVGDREVGTGASAGSSTGAGTLAQPTEQV
ncbi:major facilitator superfamily domain-containing protein [Amylostereum chailletii]|nr:major facilitator superfamily domain-containing protein [Amylostereum chailletii]